MGSSVTKPPSSITANGNWIVGAQGLHGSPYDGRTLHEALEQTERLIGRIARASRLRPRLPQALSLRPDYGTSPDRKRKKALSIRKWPKRRNATSLFQNPHRPLTLIFERL